ncbi:hypothetical protein [Streptomyces sp. NPDC051993]|uniref:hypothetical protein n=1 Tax=Streptomyces sp. NPDC051993 TaxID=3155286 RepID=UPI003424F1C0
MTSIREAAAQSVLMAYRLACCGGLGQELTYSVAGHHQPSPGWAWNTWCCSPVFPDRRPRPHAPRVRRRAPRPLRAVTP